MRKLVVLTALLAGALAAPGVAQALPARVTLEACHAGPSASDRYALFGARMSATPATRRMQIRFDVLSRRPGGPFRRVEAPGLGVWNGSDPGVRIYRFRQHVLNLRGPAVYRAVVRFRWLGADGRVLRTGSRATALCRQPDLRADLRPVDVEVTPAGDGQARYLVRLRNDGGADAPAFAVALDLGGTDQREKAVAGLGAHRGRELSFLAAPCRPGSSLRVTVDPDHQVAEAHEDDDVLVVACPAP